MSFRIGRHAASIGSKREMGLDFKQPNAFWWTSLYHEYKVVAF